MTRTNTLDPPMDRMYALSITDFIFKSLEAASVWTGGVGEVGHFAFWVTVAFLGIRHSKTMKKHTV